MIGKAVILEDDTPIYVTLTADDKGQVTLGIRINGSHDCVMAPNVTMPRPSSSQTWNKNVGDLM
jgi:hypothetical protein